jgi:hypothetical protein
VSKIEVVSCQIAKQIGGRMYLKGFLIAFAQVPNLLLAIYVFFGSAWFVFMGEWYGGLVPPVLFVSFALFYGELLTGLSGLIGWGSYHIPAWSMAIRLTWLAIAGAIYWIGRNPDFVLEPESRWLYLLVAALLLITNGPLLFVHWGKFRRMTTVL